MNGIVGNNCTGSKYELQEGELVEIIKWRAEKERMGMVLQRDRINLSRDKGRSYSRKEGAVMGCAEKGRKVKVGPDDAALTPEK